MYNNYFQNPYMNYSPISIPNRRSYFNPINGRKSIPMKDLILKAERGVDTINSMIPLYKKIQPLIDQGKNIFSKVGTLFKTNKQETSTKQVEKVEAEIVTESKEENIDYRNNENQSKPFFL